MMQAFITSIPDAVLGGMTIFLFANVLTSGISLAATTDLSSRVTSSSSRCRWQLGLA
jgi:xanthine/uracil permease